MAPRFVHGVLNLELVQRLNRGGPHRLPTDALEDVVQHVYTSLWPRLRDYHGGASLESWVFGFCRNCLRAEVRRRATRLRLLPPAPETALEGEGQLAVAAPDEAAERDERLGMLREALAQLPDDERIVVELRHLEDWSFERIARELSIAPSTVKDRGYRGMQRLERALRADRAEVRE